MTESSRIALEFQKHLRVHLNALNQAAHFAENLGTLGMPRFERMMPLALTNHSFNSPEHRSEYEAQLYKRYRECVGLDFAKIEGELRTIDSDVQTDIETGGNGISVRFYGMANSLLLDTINRHGLMGAKMPQLSIATQAIEGYVANGSIENSDANLIVHSLDVAYYYHDAISPHMKNIRLFDKIKHVNTNIVFVGANGSGKSTLAREMRDALGITSSAIAAQQPIGYGEGQFNLFESAYSKQTVQQRQREHAQSGLNNLLGCLLAEYVKSAINEKRLGANAASYGKPTLLDCAFELWGKIIPGRELHYNIDNQTMRAVNLGQNTKYPIASLSDGERTVLYYIAFVMLASENEYIVVDEPENNLNLAVVNRLWDELEKLRSDCQFIYLTHNPDFVAGRKNARTLWIKNVIPSSGKWDYEELPANDVFDERLMIELVGERRKILFCEGESDGLDCSVYKELFPDYSVKAVGSNKKVMDCVRAYKSAGIFQYSAAGVIDGDFRPDDKVRELRDESIHCLKLPAVENLLFDEELLQAAAKQFCKQDSFLNARNRLFDMLTKHKGKLAAHYAHDFAERQLRKKIPKAADTLECVIKEWDVIALPKGDDIRRAYEKRLEEIEDAINGRQYAKGLALYHSKSVMEVGGVIVDNYKSRILSLLQEKPELRKMLVKKYLPGLSAE